MTNFWKIVNSVIDSADVILEVVDARLVEQSRNPEIEKKVADKGKKLIIVINKCDLMDKKAMDRKKKEIPNSVFVSAREMLGTTILKKKILALGRKEKVIAGVLGYPNTGKSSVINALAGRSKASTSSQSGHTKGQQYIRTGKIMLIDTPGVIPFMENDWLKHALIAATDFTKVKEPEDVALYLIESLDGKIEEHYGIEKQDDPETCLERIAEKNKKLKAGGVPDTESMAKEILKDWQRGLI